MINCTNQKRFLSVNEAKEKINFHKIIYSSKLSDEIIQLSTFIKISEKNLPKGFNPSSNDFATVYKRLYAINQKIITQKKKYTLPEIKIKFNQTSKIQKVKKKFILNLENYNEEENKNMKSLTIESNRLKLEKVKQYSYDAMYDIEIKDYMEAEVSKNV